MDGAVVDPLTVQHGYAMWPPDALPAQRGVGFAESRLRAAFRTSGEARAQLLEEGVIAASADLHSSNPAVRATARLAIGRGVDGLRDIADSAPPLGGDGSGNDVGRFTLALSQATLLRDRGDLGGAREQLSHALLLGSRIDASGGGSFSFREQADAALTVHDSLWVTAHAVARDLPGRAAPPQIEGGLAGH